ncbi:TPA: helix-turn-helix domain-containing protein, partial [Enterococcus faecium]|nr:helix-turn-helix domain-containing protein [Enterococcus faecium]
MICKASSGDEMAVKEILKFYDGYISKLCLRPFYHSESGKIIMQVDEELKGEIHTDMMKAILK